MNKIGYEKEKVTPRSYEWAELDKELTALCCAIFEWKIGRNILFKRKMED